MSRYAEIQEGDFAVLRVKVARANAEEALIGFESKQGTYSIIVPVSELLRTGGGDE